MNDTLCTCGRLACADNLCEDCHAAAPAYPATRREFPDFDALRMLPATMPAGFVDASWHNDVCPSLDAYGDGTPESGRRSVRVWCDYADADRRELQSGKQFTVCIYFDADHSESVEFWSGDAFPPADVLEAARDWLRVLDGYAYDTRGPVDSDDAAMFSATTEELVGWYMDLEDRVGFDVDTMRSAVLSYCETRGYAEALDVMREAFPHDVPAQSDPRGDSLAGAEIFRGNDVIGFYLDADGRYSVIRWSYDSDDENAVSVDDGAGKLDRAHAVEQLRALDGGAR